MIKTRTTPFELTVDGCRRATEYLKSEGRWNSLVVRGFSTDGYTIVSEANDLLSKRESSE